MKIRLLLSLLCLLIVLGGCKKSNPELESCNNIRLKNADALDDDDRAIFNLIIETYYLDRKARLLQKAGAETEAKWLYSTLEGYQLTVDSSVVENYALRNDQPVQLPDDFLAPLMSGEEYDCLRTANPDENGYADFWTNFYTNYPDAGGYLDFDLPGYDPNRTHAVLQYGIYYGGLGANGYVVILEKVSGQWTIVQHQATWVS